MLITRENVLPLLAKLTKGGRVAKTVTTTHIDDQSPYVYFEEHIFVKIQAADVLLKKRHKAALFHSIYFYKYARALL